MNALGSDSPDVRVLQDHDFWLHGALLFLGSFLVLFGLTLPWPCLPGSWFEGECSPALHSLRFNDLQVGLFLALFALFMLFNAKANKIVPFNYLAWGGFWLVYFYMVYVRWVPDDMGGAFPGAHFTAFTINTGLPGITPTVLPLGLAAFWLALRPAALRPKIRWLAIAVYVLLLLFTLFFFAFEAIRVFTRAQIPNDALDVFTFGRQGIFGAAPLLILTGALALLGEEIVAIRRARTKAAAQSALAGPPVPLTRAQKVNLAGFWAAIVLAAVPLYPLLGALFPNNNDPVLYFLFSVLSQAVGPLKVIALLVLILALIQAAPPGKKSVVKIGLGLAILYAGLTLLGFVAPRMIAEISFNLAQSISLDDHGFVLSSLIGSLIGLALLFTLPVYQKKGFQLAIRWLLVINVLIEVPAVIFMDFTRHTQSIALLATALQGLLIFPAIAILLCVYFRRAARPPLPAEAAALPQVSTP